MKLPNSPTTPPRRKRGATLTGYGLIVGLIAIVGLAAITNIGGQVNSLFGEVGSELEGAVASGPGGAGGSGDSEAQATPEATPEFSFTSHTFTSCGQTGPTGPSLLDCQTAYSWASWASSTSNFNITTPGFQTFTVPETGTYRFTLNGAEGGESSSTANPGQGGRVVGEIDLTQGETITLVVGQAGEGFDLGGSDTQYFTTGGFNGGGGTGYATSNGDRCNNCAHASGGGGTDVRIGGTDLANRVLVAGGGGGGTTEGCCGASSDLRDGGDGGGLTGADGHGSSNNATSDARGRGGTQIAGGVRGYASQTYSGTDGALGQGGRGNVNDAGGGGGGYYGGGGGGDNGSGGGGSNFADGSVQNVVHSQGVNSGDGSITVELLP